MTGFRQMQNLHTYSGGTVRDSHPVFYSPAGLLPHPQALRRNINLRKEYRACGILSIKNRHASIQTVEKALLQFGFFVGSSSHFPPCGVGAHAMTFLTRKNHRRLPVVCVFRYASSFQLATGTFPNFFGKSFLRNRKSV
jgi:hypothetical protein